MNPVPTKFAMGGPAAGFETLAISSIWQGAGRPDLLPANGCGFEFWWRSHKYRHRPGGHTDFLSSPQFAQIFPFAERRGWGAPAAVPHDGVYHDDIEIWIQPQDGTPAHWQAIDLGKDNGDQLFHDLLVVLADGNEARLMEARAFYEAVHLGGQTAFDEGRQAAAGHQSEPKANGGTP